MNDKSIIKDIVDDFLEENYSADYKVLFNKAEIEIQNYKEEDKIIFIDFLREHFQRSYDEHFQNCKNREDCYDLKYYTKALFILNNIFEKYGISNVNNDYFSESERYEYIEKLDEILNRLKKLEAGQEIIYEDLENEINDLKKMFYLGKKNWMQLLAGKTFEMVSGGVLSEIVSKPLIEMTNVFFNKI